MRLPKLGRLIGPDPDEGSKKAVSLNVPLSLAHSLRTAPLHALSPASITHSTGHI